MSLSNIIKLSQKVWSYSLYKISISWKIAIYYKESESFLSFTRHPFCTLSMPLPNIIRIFQTIKKLRNAQELSVEIRSGEITRKRTEQELSFLLATLLLYLIYVPTIYYHLPQTVWELYSAQDFCFRGDNHIMKKVKVVSLARDTPTCPPIHLYQILSNYLKQYGSYVVQKMSAAGVITA